MGISLPTRSALFVATDLAHFETDDPDAYAADVVVCGKCHRRLDAAYYAWLRHRVALAKKALDAGRLAQATFDTVRAQFNAVHAWAVGHLGETALLDAVKTLDPKTYVPPRADDDDDFAGPRVRAMPPRGPRGFLFPAQGAWPFTEPVAADAVAKVDAIRDQALALGWTERSLYQNRGAFRFPYGQDYGVVCFLDDGATVVAVSRESITIQHARGNALRFSNPDIEQPWRRRAGQAPAVSAAAT